MIKQNILITGCSTGIGFCANKVLPQRGYNVVATVRNPQDTAALTALGITTVALELADSESIKQAFDFTLNYFWCQLIRRSVN